MHMGETGRAAALLAPLDLLYSNSITFMTHMLRVDTQNYGIQEAKLQPEWAL